MERFMMNVIYLIEATEKYKNKEGEKEFYYRVALNYTMHPDVRHMFAPNQYPSNIDIILDEKP